jgi:ribosomal protein S18 acetylase RimI-like enzyme
MAKVKVRRAHREELPGVVVLRDAVASRGRGSASRPVLDLDMEADSELDHLISHDPDGFLTALDRDETLGFGASHVRARQWILSQLWVLPQHQGRGAGEALLSKALAYGMSSGAKEFLAVVPTENAIQALLLKHGFRPLKPIYSIRIPVEQGMELAGAMARLMPGREMTRELLQLHGQTDLDRIDKFTRGGIRGSDHQYWLKDVGCRAAFVHQGDRVAGYGYGGRNQVGPVAGTTQEAAVAALGRALEMALEGHHSELSPPILVPAGFGGALEVLLEGGGVIRGTSMLYGRGLSAAFDRVVLGSPALP